MENANIITDNATWVAESPVDVLHDIGGRLAKAGGFHEVLDRVVEFAAALVKCDSCLVYVLEGDDLVLRASKNAHPEAVDRLKLRVGQGITGWVAEHHDRWRFPKELPSISASSSSTSCRKIVTRRFCPSR